MLAEEISESGDDYSEATAALKDATESIKAARKDIDTVIAAIRGVAESILKINKVVGMKEDGLLDIVLGLPAPTFDTEDA